MYKNRYLKKNGRKPSYGSVRVFDTFKDAGFIYNEFGHIMNDFARLMRSNDDLALANRLSSAASAPEEFQLGDTDRQKIDALRSRYEQTPAELDRYELYVLDRFEDYLKSLPRPNSPSDDDVASVSSSDVNPAAND